MREQTGALQHRHQMQGEIGGLLSLAKLAKLLLGPPQNGGHQARGLFRERASVLVQLLAKTADGTAAGGQRLTLPLHFANQRMNASFRVRELVPRGYETTIKIRTVLDQRVPDVFLGFEVVVNVTQGDRGLLGDIGQRGLIKPLRMDQLVRRFEQAKALIGFLYFHLNQLIKLVSKLSN